MIKSTVCLAALVAVAFSAVLPKDESRALILKELNDLQPDGSYKWSYDTENGISASEAAQIQQRGPEDVLKNVQGSASWTSPEGEAVQLTYVADENGYQAQGSHLPTPPPAPAIPQAIQRALEWVAAHPQLSEQPLKG